MLPERRFGSSRKGLAPTLKVQSAFVRVVCLRPMPLDRRLAAAPTPTTDVPEMTEQGLKQVNEIARAYGKNRGSVHRIIKRLGIDVVKRRSETARGQVVNWIRETDLPRIEEAFRRSDSKKDQSKEETPFSFGNFYLITLEPKMDPGRFKLGYAADVKERLSSHRTAAPFAQIIKVWPCKIGWEKTAIDCISQGCEKLYTEVFRARDIQEAVSLADRFFSLMPNPSFDFQEKSPVPGTGKPLTRSPVLNRDSADAVAAAGAVPAGSSDYR